MNRKIKDMIARGIVAGLAVLLGQLILKGLGVIR